jgi:hypothetical protein
MTTRVLPRYARTVLLLAAFAGPGVTPAVEADPIVFNNQSGIAGSITIDLPLAGTPVVDRYAFTLGRPLSGVDIQSGHASGSLAGASAEAIGTFRGEISPNRFSAGAQVHASAQSGPLSDVRIDAGSAAQVFIEFLLTSPHAYSLSANYVTDALPAPPGQLVGMVGFVNLAQNHPLFSFFERHEVLGSRTIDSMGLLGAGQYILQANLAVNAGLPGPSNSGSFSFDIEFTPSPEPVPEPATLTLLGIGLGGLVVRGVRRTAEPKPKVALSKAS